MLLPALTPQKISMALDKAMSVLVTGVSGFVGQYLISTLDNLGVKSLGLSRSESIAPESASTSLIHLAGRAHIMNDTASDPLAAFRAANCEHALTVAKQAVAAGVKRLVYVSSVKVNGEHTELAPFTELSTPAPCDPYGVSKYEAELALQALASETGLEVVIVRPPLIYGAGVKANFARLAQLTATGLPLPFGAVHNRRSLLYVKNLVDFLILCTHHPKAANQTFLLSDEEDVSTTQLLAALAKAQGAPSRLLPVPARWLHGAMRLVGKADMAQRLLGNLQVDSRKARELLGWTPPFGFEAGTLDMFKK
jgi:nucleoside-diphosphate-sugar epimerase